MAEEIRGTPSTSVGGGIDMGGARSFAFDEEERSFEWGRVLRVGLLGEFGFWFLGRGKADNTKEFFTDPVKWND
ncbi:hypothetical protein S83_001975 [Arachis hypogaea]